MAKLFGDKKSTNNPDDFVKDADTWQQRIRHRAEVLRDAREDGDPAYIRRATERLDSALDGYNRDVPPSSRG